MNFTFPDLIGSIGVVILITTFLLLQLGKLESSRLLYSLLNAVGATLIAISLIFDFNLSAFIIEIFWVLISLVGVVRTLRTKTHNT